MIRHFANRFVGIIGYLALLVLASCTVTDYRDAALAGIFDFVTGTVSDSLTALFPLANTISGG